MSLFFYVCCYFHCRFILLVALSLREKLPRGRTLATTAGMIMKTHTHLRCASRTSGVLIISAHANERSEYGKNNQILLVRKLRFQELLSYFRII